MLNRMDAYHNALGTMLSNHLSTFPSNESAEVYRNLASGRKILIAGLNSEIDAILPELKAKYPTTTFFRGKENLWSHMKNWQFLKITYSQLQAELIQLMTGGIYQFWKYWLRDRKYFESKLKESRDSPEPIPLSLRSSVSFMFVILLIGLVSASIAFLVESVYFDLVKLDIRQRVEILWRDFKNIFGNAVARLRVLGQTMRQGCKIENLCVFAKLVHLRSRGKTLSMRI